MKNNLIQEITEATPIVMCTVGQLMSFVRESGFVTSGGSEMAKANGEPTSSDDLDAKINHDGRKICGLEGIMQEFGCSKSTAQKYKKGIFKDIVVQNGHKIFLDANKAWRCYESYKGHRKGAL